MAIIYERHMYYTTNHLILQPPFLRTENLIVQKKAKKIRTVAAHHNSERKDRKKNISNTL